jgi:hypothetical protein
MEDNSGKHELTPHDLGRVQERMEEYTARPAHCNLITHSRSLTPKQGIEDRVNDQHYLNRNKASNWYELVEPRRALRRGCDMRFRKLIARPLIRHDNGKS